MDIQQNTRIALLIDCDNVSHSTIEAVLKNLTKYGKVNIKHAHGDWNSTNLNGWKEKLHPFAIRPIQQFAYTSGKNATDASIIIDAMDLLYSKTVDSFALMTSDSDFTPLVLRIVESGMTVYGFGEKKTPEPFVNACSQFTYIENLQNIVTKKDKINITNKQKTRNELRCDTKLVNLLRGAVKEVSDEDGWAHLSLVGGYISKNNTFLSIDYGFQKLSDLIKISELFSIEMRKNNSAMYIKDKK